MEVLFLECGVFARKLIPKKTRFGPMEGVLTVNDVKNDANGLKLLLDVEDGTTHRLVVSDESKIFDSYEYSSS